MTDGFNCLNFRQSIRMDNDMTSSFFLLGEFVGSNGFRFFLLDSRGDDLVGFLLHHLILGQLLLQTQVHFLCQFGIRGRGVDFVPILGQNIDDAVIRHVKFFGRLS